MPRWAIVAGFVALAAVCFIALKGPASVVRAQQSDESRAAMLERAGVAMQSGKQTGVGGYSEQFARFQSDAPSCDNCGAITVRTGNCYLCHNCGNSMGCS